LNFTNPLLHKTKKTRWPASQRVFLHMPRLLAQPPS